jgi:hypothetical protein
MAKPHVHAMSSVKRWGGCVADYIATHEFLDSSKIAMADNRHRAATHNTWFLQYVLPRVFGHTITNSDGKEVSVADIGELHVLEDFGLQFIPSLQDYLQLMPLQPWMNNGRGDGPESVSGSVSPRSGLPPHPLAATASATVTDAD